MAPRRDQALSIAFHPLTPTRWSDFEQLFGRRGACAGCWCMWWRLTGSEFSRGNASNEWAMRRLVNRRTVPGLLAYVGAEAIGWVSVGPRADFGRITRSPSRKPLDERNTWSVNCFYVARPYRRAGFRKVRKKLDGQEIARYVRVLEW